MSTTAGGEETVYTKPRGEVIGDYRILKELGEGAFAKVYLAENLLGGGRVALKILKPDVLSRRAKKFFRREALIMARLKHPYIIRASKPEKIGRTYYIAMELAKYTLEDVMKKAGKKGVATRLLEYVFFQICRALQYAHSMGVLHRDIKPSNILFTSKYVAKLGDFGVAKLIDESKFTSVRTTTTSTGVEIVGTFGYMAPEVARGEYSRKSDVYSLGVTFYEAFTGVHPLSKPKSIRKFKPKVSKALDEAIRSMLKEDPEDRPEIEEVLELLGLDEELPLDVTFEELRYLIANQKEEFKKSVLEKLRGLLELLDKIGESKRELKRAENLIRRANSIVEDLYNTLEILRPGVLEASAYVFILDYFIFKKQDLLKILRAFYEARV